MSKYSNQEIKCLTILICFLCAVLVVITIIAAAHHKQQAVVNMVNQSVDEVRAILEGLDEVGVVEAQAKLNKAAKLLREAKTAIRNYTSE